MEDKSTILFDIFKESLCIVPVYILLIIHGKAVLNNIPNILPFDDRYRLWVASKIGQSDKDELLIKLSSPERLKRIGKRMITLGAIMLALWLLACLWVPVAIALDY